MRIQFGTEIYGRHFFCRFMLFVAIECCTGFAQSHKQFRYFKKLAFFLLWYRIYVIHSKVIACACACACALHKYKNAITKRKCSFYASNWKCLFSHKSKAHLFTSGNTIKSKFNSTQFNSKMMFFCRSNRMVKMARLHVRIIIPIGQLQLLTAEFCCWYSKQKYF